MSLFPNSRLQQVLDYMTQVLFKAYTKRSVNPQRAVVLRISVLL